LTELNFIDYFNQIQAENFDSDNGVLALVNEFEQQLLACKAATKNHEVENFFAKWFMKDVNTKQFLYSMLLDTNVVERING
jgi:hypothetical protein